MRLVKGVGGVSGLDELVDMTGLLWIVVLRFWSYVSFLRCLCVTISISLGNEFSCA